MAYLWGETIVWCQVWKLVCKDTKKTESVGDSILVQVLRPTQWLNDTVCVVFEFFRVPYLLWQFLPSVDWLVGYSRWIPSKSMILSAIDAEKLWLIPLLRVPTEPKRCALESVCGCQVVAPERDVTYHQYLLTTTDTILLLLVVALYRGSVMPLLWSKVSASTRVLERRCFCLLFNLLVVQFVKMSAWIFNLDCFFY
jgi:hypothetical protein